MSRLMRELVGSLASPALVAALVALVAGAAGGEAATGQ